MALGGDHGDRGGGRGQHQSNGAGSHASGHHQHGGAEAGAGEETSRCFIPAMEAVTVLLAVEEEFVDGQLLGVVGKVVLQGGGSSVVVLRHFRTWMVANRAATNGGGGAARNVPDNTWEQIVTLLQQSVGKNQSMSNSRWDAAGMDHRPQLSPRLYTIKELYKPTHVDDKVGSTVTHVAKEKVPFCFRCKTKGHQSSDSNIELFC